MAEDNEDEKKPYIPPAPPIPEGGIPALPITTSPNDNERKNQTSSKVDREGHSLSNEENKALLVAGLKSIRNATGNREKEEKKAKEAKNKNTAQVGIEKNNTTAGAAVEEKNRTEDKSKVLGVDEIQKSDKNIEVNTESSVNVSEVIKNNVSEVEKIEESPLIEKQKSAENSPESQVAQEIGFHQWVNSVTEKTNKAQTILGASRPVEKTPSSLPQMPTPVQPNSIQSVTVEPPPISPKPVIKPAQSTTTQPPPIPPKPAMPVESTPAFPRPERAEPPSLPPKPERAALQEEDNLLSNNSVLFTQKNSRNASRKSLSTALEKNATPDPLLTQETPTPLPENGLSEQNFQVYKEKFGGNDAFMSLANEMLRVQENAKEGGFRQQMEEMKPLLQFATQGVKEEITKAKAQDDPSPEMIEKLNVKQQGFEKILNLVEGLGSLSDNKMKYQQEAFDKKTREIGDLVKKHGESDVDMIRSLNNIAENEIYQKQGFFKNLSNQVKPYDPDATTTQRSHSGVKVKYDGENVTGTFKFNRAALVGTKSGKLWHNAQSEYKKLDLQVADFVGQGLREYNKGSENNPIKISFPNKVEKPELALKVLMEVKKQAVLQNKTLYAIDHTGAKIEITPKNELSPEELAYFSHFANKTTKLKQKTSQGEDKSTTRCVGYKILKHEITDLNKQESAKSDKSDVIEGALQKYVKENLAVNRNEVSSNMDKVAENLKKPDQKNRASVKHN